MKRSPLHDDQTTPARRAAAERLQSVAHSIAADDVGLKECVEYLEDLAHAFINRSRLSDDDAQDEAARG